MYLHQFDFTSPYLSLIPYPNLTAGGGGGEGGGSLHQQGDLVLEESPAGEDTWEGDNFFVTNITFEVHFL